jgi:hypothetical protein
MQKKTNRIALKDMPEAQKRLGERQLSVADLKLVAGGMACQGGTCTICGDCDE